METCELKINDQGINQDAAATSELGKNVPESYVRCYGVPRHDLAET